MKLLPVAGATRGMVQIEHDLVGEPLLSLVQIGQAAAMLPEGAVEGTDWDGPGAIPSPLDSASAQKAIENVAFCPTWLIIRHLELLDPYRQLMFAVLEQVRHLPNYAAIEFLRPACFVFVSSAGVCVPPHVDPEHNFLLQIQGSKTVWGHRRAEGGMSLRELRAFYADEFGFRLPTTRAREAALIRCDLEPGGGVYIPVAAPHRVTNHSPVCVSFSVTFRTAEFERRRLAYLPETPAPADRVDRS